MEKMEMAVDQTCQASVQNPSFESDARSTPWCCFIWRLKRCSVSFQTGFFYAMIISFYLRFFFKHLICFLSRVFQRVQRKQPVGSVSVWTDQIQIVMIDRKLRDWRSPPSRLSETLCSPSSSSILFFIQAGGLQQRKQQSKQWRDYRTAAKGLEGKVAPQQSSGPLWPM